MEMFISTISFIFLGLQLGIECFLKEWILWLLSVQKSLLGITMSYFSNTFLFLYFLFLAIYFPY